MQGRGGPDASRCQPPTPPFLTVGPTADLSLKHCAGGCLDPILLKNRHRFRLSWARRDDESATMMGQQGSRQDQLFYAFNLEEHVPRTHLLRAIISASRANTSQPSTATPDVRRSTRS
jgi:hypothetical protein